MRRLLKVCTTVAGFGLATVMGQGAFGQDVPGQVAPQGSAAAAVGSSAPGQNETPEALAQAATPALVTFSTTLTFRSYPIGPFGSAGSLEGASCPAPAKMISGACHPLFNPQVVIINQFPNIPLNTWRCGFKNNTAANVTVFVYTLCAQ
jgi:hypothetical protein